ncbi:hypothetical protein [Zoogloea sp.]|uniref:hypothetical protein n=1 Tax=Zoogloea sp. TaxID=49181 RepID=UPI001415D25A|nr:MAG: hypothetical protein F9K15_23035 [Zoogloea sp.]
MMTRHLPCPVLAISLALAAPLAWAADAGSTAFCLFPLPADGGTQRLINLGIVQYVDVRADEVRIYFGGGNLGSGHEARLPARSRDEAEAILARLRSAATRCAQPLTGASP